MTLGEEEVASGAHMREARASLAEERRRYRELFDLAPIPYLVTDADGLIEDANLAATALFRVPRRSLRGTPISDHLGPQRMEEHLAPLLSESKNVVEWEGALQPRSGDAVPVLLRVSASRNAVLRTTTLRWIVNDLRKRFEHEAHERELAWQYAERMGALEKRKGDFLHLASHELRSPLTIMYGYLAMAMAGDFGELNPALRTHLTTVMEQTQFMSRLVDQMLETARLDDARINLSESITDLREVARRAADVPAQGEPDKSRERIALDLPKDAVTARVDPERITGVVRNLLENALKYAPSSPVTCSVRADKARRRGMVMVSDRGPGVGKRERERLFERFGRIVSPDTSNVPGTGLGLYVSREVARLHGGDLVLADAPDSGATFVLELPLADDVPAEQ